jgi:hypothetical protein
MERFAEREMEGRAARPGFCVNMTTDGIREDESELLSADLTLLPAAAN